MNNPQDTWLSGQDSVSHQSGTGGRFLRPKTATLGSLGLLVVVVAGALVLRHYMILRGLGSQAAGNQTIYYTQELRDSTGQVFETKKLTKVLKADGRGGLESLVTTPYGVFTESELIGLSDLGLSGKTVDQPKSPGSVDASGVIVELTADSELQKFNATLKSTKSLEQAQGSATKQRSLIAAQQQAATKKIQNSLGKTLAFNSKASTKSSLRSARFTTAINAIALRDVSVAEAQAKLSGLAEVKRVVPNYTVKAFLADSAPLVKAGPVWTEPDPSNRLADGTGMRIGIIDTGIDYFHQDLGGCLGAGCKVEGGYDFVNLDSDPMDDHGHGTHVAATAAGQGFLATASGNKPLFGVAPGAKLYGYKVLDNFGSGFTDQIIGGIERCADPNQDGNSSDHLDVCSMSLGGFGNPDDLMSTAVDNVTATGVVFTIAAGNSGPSGNTIGSPGTARSAITVAASCKPADVGSDEFCPTDIAEFSSRGPVQWNDAQGNGQSLDKPDIAAPGHKICAAEHGSWLADRRCGDSSHIAISGTSMATPHVAGVVALVRQLHPTWTPAEVKEALTSTAHSYGLSRYAQGAGLVDAAAAAELPSNGIKVKGSPVVMRVKPMELKQPLRYDLTIVNSTDQVMFYSPKLLKADPGLQVASTIPISIGARSERNLALTILVDNNVVPNPGILRGIVSLDNPTKPITLPITIVVDPRLEHDQNSVDFGLDLADDPNWSVTQNVNFHNTFTDTSLNYKASVVCCDFETTGDGTSFDNPSLKASASPATFTLSPNGNQAVALQVNIADNSSLPNGRYNGYLKVFDPTRPAQDAVFIPFTFFKGYSLNLQFTEPVPDITEIFNANGFGLFLFPDPSVLSQQVYLRDGAETSVASMWFGPNTDINSYNTFDDHINLHQKSAQVSIDKNKATHAITLNPVDMNGNSVSIFNGLGTYRFVHKATGSHIGISGSFGRMQVYTSDLSSEYSFVAQAATITSDSVVEFLYHVENGITGNISLDNDPAKFIIKDLVSYPNVDIPQPYIYPAACDEIYQFGGYPAIGCLFASWVNMPVKPGQIQKLYVANHDPKDISNSPVPDYPSINFVLTADPSFCSCLYNSPSYYITPSQTYTWLNALSGTPNWAFSLPGIYNAFKVDPPPGNQIVLGNAPIFDNSRWLNFADQQIGLVPNRGPIIPLHLWGGFSQELFRDANITSAQQFPHLRIIRDGTTVVDKTVTATFEATYLNDIWPVPPGNYTWELKRPAMINGVQTTVQTTGTFRVVSLAQHEASPVDENPPALRGLTLTSSGLWQNLIQAGKTNELVFEVDPVPGIVGFTGTPLTEMPDGLSQTRLDYSVDKGATWHVVSLQDLGQGKYKYTFTSPNTVPLWGFRFSATDLAGNTLTYQFELPVQSGPPEEVVRTVTLSAPDTANQTANLTIDATGFAANSQLEIYVDNALTFTTKVAAFPYNYALNVSKLTNAPHTVMAKVFDATSAVNSNTKTISIQNTATPTSTKPPKPQQPPKKNK